MTALLRYPSHLATSDRGTRGAFGGPSRRVITSRGGPSLAEFRASSHPSLDASAGADGDAELVGEREGHVAKILVLTHRERPRFGRLSTVLAVLWIGGFAGADVWTRLPAVAGFSVNAGISIALLIATTLFLVPILVFTVLLRKHLLRGITFGAVRK